MAKYEASGLNRITSGFHFIPSSAQKQKYLLNQNTCICLRILIIPDVWYILR